MVEHPVQSLRKSAALLQKVAENWLQGAVIEVPSECGPVLLHSGGRCTAVADRPRSETAALEAVLETFWPGPLWVRLRTSSGPRDFWTPHHPLFRALLQLTGPAGCDLSETAIEPELRLIWKLPLLPVSWSHLDASSAPWRWLRTGAVERRAVEWAGGMPTLLSE